MKHSKAVWEEASLLGAKRKLPGILYRISDAGIQVHPLTSAQCVGIRSIITIISDVHYMNAPIYDFPYVIRVAVKTNETHK